MKRLRAKDGCPWDRKQTMQSLRRCVLEEAHEVLEALASKNRAHIEEELGDMLVVVSMLIAMGEEKKMFSKKSILDKAIGKMILRHPHVFGKKKARSADEALALWTDAKMEERKKAGQKSVLAGFESSLPALLSAYKIQRKAARVGFDWEKPEPIFKKIEEELRELKHEIKIRNQKRQSEELGDFLFSAVNLARKLNIDPEIALKDAVSKFKRRFLQIEKKVNDSGREWKSYSLKELDGLWEMAKNKV